MDVGPTEIFIIGLWRIASNLSPKETIKKKGSKRDEILELQVPTISSWEGVFDSIDWTKQIISRDEAMYYLNIFHISYLNNFIG